MNVKGALQELCQKRGFGIPKYSLASSEGAAHCPVFIQRVTVEWEGKTLTETGQARSKKEAEKSAASAMIERLRLTPDVKDEYDPYAEPVSSPSQFKVTLNEMLQSEHLPLSQYDVVSVKGPAHKREFTIKCTIYVDEEIERLGCGSTKKLAESNAAANMLKYLEARAGGRQLSVEEEPLSRASGDIPDDVLRGVEVDYVDMKGEGGVFLCLASTDQLAAHGVSSDSLKHARDVALRNLKLSVIDLKPDHCV